MLDLQKPESPIVPIIIGEEKKTLSLSKYLYKHGFIVGAIRPPTVPKNTSRLRVAFNSSHTIKQIKDLAILIKAKLKSYA